MLAVEVCVHLRGRYALVTEELLHLAYVSTPLEHVCSVGVAQRVWAYLLLDASECRSTSYYVKDHYACEWLATVVQKESSLGAMLWAAMLHV